MVARSTDIVCAARVAKKQALSTWFVKCIFIINVFLFLKVNILLWWPKGHVVASSAVAPHCRTMACKQAAMSWIFNGAGSFEKLPVQEDGPRTCHSERSEESQNECAEAKHIKIQDFSYLTTFHCNSIFALLLSFPKSLNFLLSPQTLPVSQNEPYPLTNKKASPNRWAMLFCI